MDTEQRIEVAENGLMLVGELRGGICQGAERKRRGLKEKKKNRRDSGV